jgi:glycosyltransferase involved in cell wall biosynthesis
MHEKVSVCIPVYNGSNTILQTINSILVQTFKDFELVIVDNASTDNTAEIVRSIKDDRIKLYINQKNIGCGRNLDECKKRATGDILFYIAADDLADINAIEKVYNAFKISEDVGIVTRPYFWFDEDVTKPVRIKKRFSEDQIVSINDSYDKVADVVALSDQISGTGFRKKYMNFSFRQEYFVETASMVIPILKNCKAMILKDNIVAIRITSRNCRNPLIYEKSPMLSWYNLIVKLFNEDKYEGLRKYLINNFVANNYVGLVQIKNFGGYNYLFREIYYLIRLRWKNILNVRFWFFSMGTIVIPRIILTRMTVIFKNKINSKFIKNIKFDCSSKDVYKGYHKRWRY